MKRSLTLFTALLAGSSIDQGKSWRDPGMNRGGAGAATSPKETK
jgi:hypothetical protein